MNKYYKKHVLLISQAVCKRFEIAPALLQSSRRMRAIVVPRQITWAISKAIFGDNVNMEDLGELLGGKNYATVIHGIKTVKNLCDTNKHFKAMYEEIMAIVNQEIIKEADKNMDVRSRLADLLVCKNIKSVKDQVNSLLATLEPV